MNSALEISQAVRRGETTALAQAQASLQRIQATDSQVNAFTLVTAERALARAAAIDAAPDKTRWPLAGVPFAVKNLFDIQGVTTLAGSKIERRQAPATHDACLVQRLEAAGAVLVGALNMDEYAYGFTTENSHAGPTRNPHDLSRVAGGSSGGSGAAVAAGQVPLTLGSDTNGSIRVPASLCGVFGLKPTFGRLPRTGSYPFISSLDHLGPLARSAGDLALAYDVMQGPEAVGAIRDPGCAQRHTESTLSHLHLGAAGLRIGVLKGWFEDNATPPALKAVQAVARALQARERVDLPLVEAGRAAAFLITNAEAASLHLHDLQTRADDFEPLSRDRFLAGALIPAAWVARAQRVRLAYARAVAEVFKHCDLLIAAATPCPATVIGTELFDINGRTLPVRPSMGLLTQPISCIGLPVCSVPVWNDGAALPIGVQLIAAPWREDLVLRVAAELEAQGLARSPVAALPSARWKST
jgi:amidase/aspartyl-tRNA(Asn)/glutamyl-tRNA(Gln) amidotransferase subunit A